MTVALTALLTLTLGAQDSLETLRADARDKFQSEEFEAAIPLYRAIVERDDKDGQAWHHLGFCLHAAGQLDEAMKAHLRATEFKQWAPTATYNIACVYSLRNDKDKAIEWLRKAVDAGFTQADHVATDGDMDNVRDDARFKEIVASMGEAPRRVTAYTPVTARASARLALFGNAGSPGQVAIDYGQPPWKDEYAHAVESPNSVGKRWRFGSDFWTTLDTNIALTLGDTEVAAGAYYLALTNKGDGNIALVLLDPADVRARKLDAYVVDRAPAGKDVALTHTVVDDEAGKLQISFVSDADEVGKAELVIRFGPHRLSAPVALHLGGH